MEKGQGKGTDTLQKDDVFARKEYIEREATLQALCEAVHTKDGNIPCRNQLVSCLWTGTRTQEYAEKILAIPTADVVEVRHGKWEEVEVTDISENTNLGFSAIASMRCNKCNRYHNEVYHYGNPTEMTLYCPWCGARMDGDSNGV
jgi:hypothetical protein